MWLTARYNLPCDYLDLYLKVLKLVNVIYNKLDIDITFEYNVKNDNVFYIIEEYEDLECRLYHADGSYFITISDSAGSTIGFINLTRLGKFSLINIDKSDFIDNLSYAYKLYEVNVKIIESIK